jgi:putative peptidoglycan lipid II flippase
MPRVGRDGPTRLNGGDDRGGVTHPTLVLALLLMVSRLMGFVRSQVMAALFGATGETDAFIVAVSVATLVTALTGPVTMTFLPVYAAAMGKGDAKAASRVASETVTLVSGFMMIACVTLAAFAPSLTRLMAPGFGDLTYVRAVSLARIMLAAMVLPLLASLAKSILNTRRQFIIPAVADIIENVAVVLVLLRLASTMGVASLGIASSTGFLILFIIQYLALKRAGLWPALELGFGPETRKVFILALPLVGSWVFSGLHRFVDKALASGLSEGSMAVLEYAERIRGLPMGVLVAAATTVMAPSLSRFWGKGDARSFAGLVEDNLRSIEFVCVPIAAGMMVLAQPIVRLAFERGAFTPEATRATAAALVAYAPGLAAMAATRVIMSALISSQKTGLQVLVGICSSLLNVGLNFAFIGHFGHVGLALASTVAGFLTLAASLFLLRRDHRRYLDIRALAVPIGKMAVAATVMAGAAVWLSERTGLAIGTGDTTKDFMLLVLVATVSAAVYFILAAALGCDEAVRLKMMGRLGRRR